ncbi:MAG TPA: FtsW/RodA/SpoVE family cell cycle protein, partial [Pyrinomonadaceae bacterium]|nr:FtsW/RodA/SpoVE family cell cycle protein [Pyrinomonadaceae bacterium]
MAQKLQYDRWLFSATIGLALFGVVMVYSASAVIAQQENYSQFHYVIKQAVWTSIGFVAMFVAMHFDYQKLNSRWVVYGALLVTVLLLLAVFGFRPINGARRWIRYSSFSLQPSEIAKLTLVIFLARFLDRRSGDEDSFWRTFLPCMLVIGLLAGLVIKEPDLGTALMLAIA